MVPRALGGLGHRLETFTTVLLLLSVWSCGLLSPAGFSRLLFFFKKKGTVLEHESLPFVVLEKKERHYFRTRMPAFCCGAAAVFAGLPQVHRLRAAPSGRHRL